MANVPEHKHPEYEHSVLLVCLTALTVGFIALTVVIISQSHSIEQLEQKVEQQEK